MPTAHRRHAITETRDISDALDIARRVWPDLAQKPGALLRQLILVGRNTIAHNDTEAIDQRRQAIAETSGAMAGIFGADYLDQLREDWPE